jgi:uncharacterized protein YceK
MAGTTYRYTVKQPYRKYGNVNGDEINILEYAATNWSKKALIILDLKQMIVFSSYWI